MSNCTTGVARDAALHMREDLQSRQILSAENVSRSAADLVASIAAQYDFRRDDEMTLLSADGELHLVTMVLSHKFTASDPVRIFYDAITDEWLACLPVPATIPARAFIQAVKERVETNRFERLSREQEEDLQDYCADVQAA